MTVNASTMVGESRTLQTNLWRGRSILTGSEGDGSGREGRHEDLTSDTGVMKPRAGYGVFPGVDVTSNPGG